MNGFINMKLGSMNVKDYSIKFTQLVRYSITMVANSMAHIRKFVSCISEDAVRKYRTFILLEEMDISRFMVHAQQITLSRAKGKIRGPNQVALISLTKGHMVETILSC